MSADYFSRLSYLMLEANSSCNLHCVGCTRDYLESIGQRERKNLNEAELRHILEQLKDCPLQTIKFEGLSEPMMHPEFHKLAEILRVYFSKAEIIVFTNLQYELKKSPLLQTIPFVSFLHLSIDGVGSTYEKIRAGAKFNRLLKSLDEIRIGVPKEIRSKKIHINFTAFEENYHQVPEIYSMCEEYGLAGVRINLAQNWNEAERNQRLPKEEMLQFLKKYKKDVRGVGGWEYKDCFWPFRGMVIDVFGNIRQCVLNTTQEPLGNAFESSIKKVFNESKHLNEMREALNKNSSAKSCGTCDYFHLSDTIKTIHGQPRQHEPFPK